MAGFDVPSVSWRQLASVSNLEPCSNMLATWGELESRSGLWMPRGSNRLHAGEQYPFSIINHHFWGCSFPHFHWVFLSSAIWGTHFVEDCSCSCACAVCSMASHPSAVVIDLEALGMAGYSDACSSHVFFQTLWILI